MHEEEKPQSEMEERAQKAISNELSDYMNPKINNITNTTLQDSIAPILTPKQNISSKPIIRTYKSDIEDTVQSGHISSINIAIAENKKMMSAVQGNENKEKNKEKNKNIIILGSILIVGGVLALAIPYFFINKQSQSEIIIETVSSNPIFTTDVQEKINLNVINTDRVAMTLNERVKQSSTKLGQIKDFYIVTGQGINEKPITSINFFNLIKSNIPDEIQRTLKSQYIFGMHNYNGNQEFLVLKVGSYDTTFSGMLTWENYLWQDFKNIFGLSDESNAIDQVQKNSIEIKKFQDATFANKDCRIVKDSKGNIIFLYSIIDPNTVVIATSVDTLKEIINRINKSRVVTQ
jgi:hypothetical protein